MKKNPETMLVSFKVGKVGTGAGKGVFDNVVAGDKAGKNDPGVEKAGLEGVVETLGTWKTDSAIALNGTSTWKKNADTKEDSAETMKNSSKVYRADMEAIDKTKECSETGEEDSNNEQKNYEVERNGSGTGDRILGNGATDIGTGRKILEAKEKNTNTSVENAVGTAATQHWRNVKARGTAVGQTEDRAKIEERTTGRVSTRGSEYTEEKKCCRKRDSQG